MKCSSESSKIMILLSVLSVTAIAILQLKEFVATRWKLWKTLQAWQTTVTHSAVSSWLQKCRIPTGGGWWSVVGLMTKSNRHLDCLKDQIRKAREEHETSTRRILAILLCFVVCLHVTSFLLLLCWGWPGDKNKPVQEIKMETKTKKADKKPLLKRFRNKWKKYTMRRKVRNVNICSYKTKPRTFQFKKKMKKIRNIILMKRSRGRRSITDSQIMKELEAYITKNKRKTYIYFLKVAVKQMFQVLVLMTMKTIRLKLGLRSPVRHGGSAKTKSKMTYYRSTRL